MECKLKIYDINQQEFGVPIFRRPGNITRVSAWFHTKLTKRTCGVHMSCRPLNMSSLGLTWRFWLVCFNTTFFHWQNPVVWELWSQFVAMFWGCTGVETLRVPGTSIASPRMWWCSGATKTLTSQPGSSPCLGGRKTWEKPAEIGVF